MYRQRNTHTHFRSAPKALEVLESIHGNLAPVRYGANDGPAPSGQDEYIVYYRGMPDLGTNARSEEIIAIVDREPGPTDAHTCEGLARDFWESRNGTRQPRANILASVGFDELITLLEEARALPPEE